jgi:flagellar biosynthesis/type III secretory pathway protein FliH
MSGKILKGGDIKRKEGAQATPARHSAEVLPDAGGVIHKRVLDASQEANRIIASAEAEAARIREEARRILTEAEAKRQAEQKRGYVEGESKGLAQVTEKLIALERLRERFYEDAEPEIVRLVLSIAEKVIGSLAEGQSDMIRSVVRLALEKALGDRIVVRLNPDDYRTLMAGDHEFRDMIDRTRRLTFREDDALAKGGCIVETEVGTIDAQLETQLSAIRKALGS